MSIPQSFLDDPFLTVKDVMKILDVKKSKAYELMSQEMIHYKDTKHVRVRQSWLQKWIDDHTEGPSDRK